MLSHRVPRFFYDQLVKKKNCLEEEEVVEHQRAHFQEPTVSILPLAVECQECKLSEIIFSFQSRTLLLISVFKGNPLKLLMETLASEERMETPDKGFPCAQVRGPVAWDGTSASSH